MPRESNVSTKPHHGAITVRTTKGPKRTRPCHRGKGTPCGECRLCRLFLSDPRYAKLWTPRKPYTLSQALAKAGQAAKKIAKLAAAGIDIIKGKKAKATEGPGTELAAILASLGISEKAGCACKKLAAQMNGWGVAGCRERKGEIVQQLREGAAEFGWKARLTAAALAVVTGIVVVINPLDPLPGLVDEAIRRAEAKDTKEPKGE